MKTAQDRMTQQRIAHIQVLPCMATADRRQGVPASSLASNIIHAKGWAMNAATARMPLRAQQARLEADTRMSKGGKHTWTPVQPDGRPPGRARPVARTANTVSMANTAANPDGTDRGTATSQSPCQQSIPLVASLGSRHPVNLRRCRAQVPVLAMARSCDRMNHRSIPRTWRGSAGAPDLIDVAVLGTTSSDRRRLSDSRSNTRTSRMHTG